jgi:hypothetical protein
LNIYELVSIEEDLEKVTKGDQYNLHFEINLLGPNSTADALLELRSLLLSFIEKPPLPHQAEYSTAIQV